MKVCSFRIAIKAHMLACITAILVFLSASIGQAQECVRLDPGVCKSKQAKELKGVYHYDVCGKDLESLETITDLFCETSVFIQHANKLLEKNKKLTRKIRRLKKSKK